MKSKKGAAFEREVCVQLSEWWTKGKRQDVFWRTSNSGGRATMRSYSGKKTFGQCGDITATDPIGSPLTRLCSIELKRGYTYETFADLPDKPDGAPSQWRDFLKQARREAKQGGNPYWLLIVRRDRREAMIYKPLRFFNQLRKVAPESWWNPRPDLCVMMSAPLGNRVMQIIGLRLEEFFKRCSPSHIYEIHTSR